MSFSQKILLWYYANKRNLPWRNTQDPYKVWLSEIILQQTRVAQGTPYYLKFVENFPTVADLASAPEDKVLKLWQGLGYYTRARNLHATAKIVANELGGRFPDSYVELLKLKGIGDYTASAIASICFGEAQPVVDGNVYRVLARYFGVDIPSNTTRGVKYFKELATEVMDDKKAGDHNQGIMEFGAILCAPKKPNCLRCPLNESCMALKNNQVHALPVKVNRTKIQKRNFNYLVWLDGIGNTRLRQRKDKGIWQNLWEFPLMESEELLNEAEFRKKLAESQLLDPTVQILLHNEQPIVHKLSHRHLHTKFWILRTEAVFDDGISPNDLEAYPVPVLISDFLKAFKISYF